MKQHKVKIKNKVFKVTVVDTEDDMKNGLAGEMALAKGTGMLFDTKEDVGVTMTMKGMLFPLDMVFICSNLKVIEVVSMEIGGTEASVKEAMFVLEVNKGEAKGMKGEKVFWSQALAKALKYPMNDDGNITSTERELEEAAEAGKGFVEKAEDKKEEKKEDEKEEKKEDEPKKESKKDNEEQEQNVNIIINVGKYFPQQHKKMEAGGVIQIVEDDVKAEEGKLQVLDDSGKVLMNIEGGERIFSIKHTEELIALAKKLDADEITPATLGKRMQEIIEIQNTQKPEYTDY